MKLILLGPPGAGKGTQAEMLAKHFSIPTISTGKMLRAEVKNGTPVGREAQNSMRDGELVSDDIIIELIAGCLKAPDNANGFILDGVPRTIAQAQALEQLGVIIDRVISIELSDEEIISRLSNRRVCSSCGMTYHNVANPPKTEGVCNICGLELEQRNDDSPAVIRNRLKTYHTMTKPLQDYYSKQGKLALVESGSSAEETFQAILSVLGR